MSARLLSCIRAVAIGLLLSQATPVAAARSTWMFDVFLDDERIGYHRFTVRDQSGERDVSIEARFAVNVLGIPVYRYTHDASERWRDGCLIGLWAATDDNGTTAAVDARRAGDGPLIVSFKHTGSALPGCVMSFAYWDAAIVTQKRLLNSQTGAYDAVRIDHLPAQPLCSPGAEQPAEHYRITGAGAPIDLWYSAQGDWLGLASTVAGGRRLRYRLRD